MPTAATTVAGTASPGTSRSTSAPIATVPFIRASSEHRESTGIDVTRQLNAGNQDLGVFDIPAYGYLRSLLIVVTASGGVGAPTFFEDYPWSVLQNVALTEPNGAVIAQFNSGYELMLANKWGGYRHVAGIDPRSSPAYNSNVAVGDFTFVLRIPVEINLRDSLGSLPNQNAAATFKLRMQLGSGAVNGGLYTGTAPTTLPSVRVQVYLEAWDQPEAGQAGMSNQVTPPAMNTTQFWSSQIFNLNSGQNTIRLTRVGNYIRNLIFICRRAGAPNVRVTGDADFPDPSTFYLDTRPLDTVSKGVWRHTMFERSGMGSRAPGGALTAPALNEGAGALDNGVFLYDFTHEFDGSLGHENRDLWLPTLGSTRLELQGVFGNTDVLTVLTNDVAIAGPVFL